MSTTAPAPDLLSEDFFVNPFPVFERLRQEAPVYYFEPLRSFILTRYTDIEAFVKNPRFSARREQVLLGGMGFLGDDEASKEMLSTWSRLILFQDAPRHPVIRQLIMKGFSPVAVESMRPRIAALVEQALEKARSQRELDIVSEFAEFIALNTIAELFAIPAQDRPRFLKWSIDLLKPAGADAEPGEAKRAVRQSTQDMLNYIRRLAAERRESPGDDLMSRFLAEEQGNSELAEEATFQSFQMIGAGFVTSMNQIANTVLSLLKHPEALQQLRQNPGLLKSAIEEALRFEPAVLSVSRLCLEDTELHGVKIPKGQLVFALIASANRDPALCPEPERFDITRARQKNATFGVGAHYCPGAPLIRIEIEEALRGLLTLPRWELGEKPYDYAGSNLQDRGPRSLHVRFPLS